MIKQLSISILTMFGIGRSGYAPGSAASFITCLAYIYFYTQDISIVLLLMCVIIVFVFSVYSIDQFKNSFTEIDAKEIVIDEFIGQSVPILTIYNFIEKNNLNHFILYTFLSFVLFRIFDILKPYPINKIDKEMKNGFGIILDDVVAGVCSAMILFIIIFFVNYA
ncbi:phosphatidylglycerophosphatase A [Pelagibacteraceae bacterium]|nr:phosphatidylglycerophosphatase A [Pelagibacteraceae bacterium]MDC0426843.1 phosphatidylglycerophosphatase A [Pelagibacteraceae bacterium]